VRAWKTRTYLADAWLRIYYTVMWLWKWKFNIKILIASASNLSSHQGILASCYIRMQRGHVLGVLAEASSPLPRLGLRSCAIDSRVFPLGSLYKQRLHTGKANLSLPTFS
jgi:hypothetical protein